MNVMTPRKLHVFISSTYRDLIAERQAAVSAILSAGHIPAGMELFAAGDESQLETIRRWIEDCDLLMLILGSRYGSVDRATGLSYTELEYNHAVAKGKPLFALVASDEAIDRKVKTYGINAVEQENPHKLRAFRENVLTRTSKFFSDDRDIAPAVLQTLTDLQARHSFVGWIRANSAAAQDVQEFRTFHQGFASLLDALGNNRPNLDLVALTSSRFVRQVEDSGLSFGTIRLILPSVAALRTFYANHGAHLLSTGSGLDS
jgi:Domain of unknown function (DUF4062)